MEKLTMEKLVNYCKQYGFIFQGSEIYGGLSNSWDYGPLGKELKENIKRAWWQKFIQENKNNYGLDAAIIMNPNVWVASGHVDSFSDPLIDCKKCKTRHRADKLIEEFTEGSETGDGWSNEKLEQYIKENHIGCPKCGSEDFTEIRQFNLLFETHVGVTNDTSSKVYLRGETAQGIFVNFMNVYRTMRAKLPFGIGQIGKAFRNEITPGNFIFRTREFEQMELEYFCKPGTDLDEFNYWKKYCLDFLYNLGINKDNLRYRDHEKDELVFYSKATTDIEYNYPMGWGELWGIADRTDYDLGVHEKHSNCELKYLDPIKVNKKVSVAIVGYGPCGIFSALNLSKAGVDVTVIERGKKVEERVKDVEELFLNHTLNKESNVSYGEGGAGTFSDGKLNTGVNDKYAQVVYNEFVKYGAHEEIIYDSHPHIGSDVLRNVLINIRKDLEKDVTYLFEHTLIDLESKNNKVILSLKNKNEIIKKEKQTAIIVTHDLAEAICMAKPTGGGCLPTGWPRPENAEEAVQ